MARTVRHAELGSRTARNKLKKRHAPHWQDLLPGTHLGYQRKEKALGQASGVISVGRWILRRYLGGGNKYRITPLGLADDIYEADGKKILSFDQAKAAASAMCEMPDGDKKIQNLTVRQAMVLYIKFKEGEGQPVSDALSRGSAHILPPLGDLVVSQLTDDTLRNWRNALAASPAQRRPKGGKVKFSPKPEGDENIQAEYVRRRRASANRVLTLLKAILNYAFDSKQVNNRDAWGRRLKPFKDVDSARPEYLSIAEAQRLLNSCEPDFRQLVRAALETGARYSELGRLVVTDFHPDSGTVAIRKSKSGKARHIILTEQGSAFFKSITAGRARSDRMFTHADGTTWTKGQQTTRITEACERAGLMVDGRPAITFHGTRHTWASHAVMNKVPLMVVAKNLGHKDTKMVEKHYGHLAADYITEAIREGAPRFDMPADKKIVTLR